ncbi:MAG: ATP-binding cassette domain-containing protein [Acidothermus sp.]|nr:ATP-binding cassette domain-containing protein [Acidothermus sp.]
MSDEVTTVAVEPLLRLEGITKTFGGVTALSDVTLDIRPGEVHALLGENGAGKSTLVNIAGGILQPSMGRILFDGKEVSHLTPSHASALGIAVVHQHPALLPDLTVEENLRVALPALFDDGTRTGSKARELLSVVGATCHPKDRVGALDLAERHLIELAKAFAVKPALLILDEPTAPLGPDATERLFALVREAAARGTAVVYITHRLAEVREIADVVTVLRDGRLRGTFAVDRITDAQLLSLIVGRDFASTFPPKRAAIADESTETALSVEALSGPRFSNVSFSMARGEIVGLFGIVGNGQSEILRALAGIGPSRGTVVINGERCSARRRRQLCAFIPPDRKAEGVFNGLSVRENVTLAALGRIESRGLVSRRQEREALLEVMSVLAIRAPSTDAPIEALSGGNQQKAVFARALLAKPAMLVADEPTQGVDVGARAEIYQLLRQLADEGVLVVVASSDAKEIEGLCDTVMVISRGSVIDVLRGDDVTEERIVTSALRATGHAATSSARGRASGATRLRRFLEGDYAPVFVLSLAIVVLGAVVFGRNHRFLEPFNLTSLLMSLAALGFIAAGQTAVLMTGGIDLSVGPLAGFVVVVGSFFLTEGFSVGSVILGFVLMVVAAAGTGLVNGGLIRGARFTPVAATLGTYIALQGLGFLLRSSPGGYIASSITGPIKHTVGAVPVVFIVLLVLTIVMELALRGSRIGMVLRGVGSDIESTRRLGVRVGATVVSAYVFGSLLVLLGGVVLLAQLGVGDASQGVGYTLSSISAVVLGGTSLLGGRGTFVGSLLGAALIVEMLNSTVFLNLSQTWQYLFQGLVILVAAAVYSQARRRV